MQLEFHRVRTWTHGEMRYPHRPAACAPSVMRARFSSVKSVAGRPKRLTPSVTAKIGRAWLLPPFNYKLHKSHYSLARRRINTGSVKRARNWARRDITDHGCNAWRVYEMWSAPRSTPASANNRHRSLYVTRSRVRFTVSWDTAPARGIGSRIPPNAMP